MVKILRQTEPAVLSKALDTDWPDSLRMDIELIGQISDEFMRRVLQINQNAELTKKDRAKRIMVIGKDINNRLDELEAGVYENLDPYLKQSAANIILSGTYRARPPVMVEGITPDSAGERAQLIRLRRTKLDAIQSVRDLWIRTYRDLLTKDAPWIRIADTLVGWIFIIGLLMWVYVLRKPLLSLSRMRAWLRIGKPRNNA